MNHARMTRTRRLNYTSPGKGHWGRAAICNLSAQLPQRAPPTSAPMGSRSVPTFSARGASPAPGSLQRSGGSVRGLCGESRGMPRERRRRIGEFGAEVRPTPEWPWPVASSPYPLPFPFPFLSQSQHLSAAFCAGKTKSCSSLSSSPIPSNNIPPLSSISPNHSGCALVCLSFRSFSVRPSPILSLPHLSNEGRQTTSEARRLHRPIRPWHLCKTSLQPLQEKARLSSSSHPPTILTPSQEK